MEKGALEKVLVELKERKDNNQELNQDEQLAYGEFVQSFFDSVKSKLDELKEGDISIDIKQAIESKLTSLSTGLEALTLEQTILKIQEMQALLEFEVDLASNSSIKTIEQMISGSDFSIELQELSENIKETEEENKQLEEESKKAEEENTTTQQNTSTNIEKQDKNVTKLFDNSSLSDNASKKNLDNNDYLNVSLGSKTKNFFGKFREGTKNVGGKVGKALRSPFGIALGAGVGITSLISKKFRRGVGKVIGAPFAAVGGGVQRAGTFAVNLVTYPFRRLGGLFRREKVKFNRIGTEKKDDSSTTSDNPNNFFGTDGSESYEAEKPKEEVKEEITEEKTAKDTTTETQSA